MRVSLEHVAEEEEEEEEKLVTLNEERAEELTEVKTHSMQNKI